MTYVECFAMFFYVDKFSTTGINKDPLATIVRVKNGYLLITNYYFGMPYLICDIGSKLIRQPSVKLQSILSGSYPAG